MVRPELRRLCPHPARQLNEDQQVRETVFSFVYWFGMIALFTMAVRPIDAAVFSIWRLSADDTDAPGRRSGMRLSTDYRTGCQYLASPWGGITPRMDRNGKQICN